MGTKQIPPLLITLSTKCPPVFGNLLPFCSPHFILTPIHRWGQQRSNGALELLPQNNARQIVPTRCNSWDAIAAHHSFGRTLSPAGSRMLSPCDRTQRDAVIHMEVYTQGA